MPPAPTPRDFGPAQPKLRERATHTRRARLSAELSVTPPSGALSSQPKKEKLLELLAHGNHLLKHYRDGRLSSQLLGTV